MLQSVGLNNKILNLMPVCNKCCHSGDSHNFPELIDHLAVPSALAGAVQSWIKQRRREHRFYRRWIEYSLVSSSSHWPADLHVLTSGGKFVKHNPSGHISVDCGVAGAKVISGGYLVRWVQAVASCRGAGVERVALVLALAIESESDPENFLHPARGLRLPGKW